MLNFKPKKFKKFHTKRIGHKKNVIYRQNPVFGNYLIKSKDFFQFTSTQFLSCKGSITKIIKAENKLLLSKGPRIEDNKLVRGFNYLGAVNYPLVPDFTLTTKPRETRMGKGKGNVSLNFFPVKKGKVLVELRNLNERIATKCFNAVKHKLPGKAFLVKAIY